MTTLKDCFICKKHNGTIKTSGITIYEDQHIYVGHIDHSGKPGYLGHIMIDLKRHARTLGDMTDEEASSFGIATARVSRALMVSEGAEHIYSLVAGNNVPHLHMHLVARYPNTPEEFWGPMAVYDWADAPKGDEKAITALCQRLKLHLESS